MGRYKIVSWIALIASVVLLVLPRIFPICTGFEGNGNPMRCHYAYQAEFIIALLAVILSAGPLVLRTAEARLLAGFIIFLLGIIVIVLPQPWAIGICPHLSTPCHKTTFFVTIGGGILALAGALLAWFNLKTSREEYTWRS